MQHLAACSYRRGSGRERKALTYADLSKTAEEAETFQFLAGTRPLQRSGETAQGRPQPSSHFPAVPERPPPPPLSLGAEAYLSGHRKTVVALSVCAQCRSPRMAAEPAPAQGRLAGGAA